MMQAEIEAIEETYRHMEEGIHNLVECFAIPHTRMCMRWSHPTRGEYRAEVIAWLEDYALSFRRLPSVPMPGRPPVRGLIAADPRRTEPGGRGELRPALPVISSLLHQPEFVPVGVLEDRVRAPVLFRGALSELHPGLPHGLLLLLHVLRRQRESPVAP